MSSAERQAWIQSGCPVQGPNGWTQYSTASGEKYFHNSNTNETQWEVPEEWNLDADESTGHGERWMG